MSEILIVSHGPLASSMKKTLELIINDVAEVEVVSLNDGQSIEDFYKKLNKTINWESKEEVCVLVDIYNGSPCQSIINILRKSEKPYKIISGLSLPILIDVYMRRNEKISEIIDEVIIQGRESIVDVIKTLNQMKLSEYNE